MSDDETFCPSRRNANLVSLQFLAYLFDGQTLLELYITNIALSKSVYDT